MNDFNIINCDQEFCFICKELISAIETRLQFESFSGNSWEKIVGSIFSHISFDGNFFTNQICASCELKIKSFDEFQSKANTIKDKIVSLYEKSKGKFQEIEQLDIENIVDFTFEPIELEMAEETNGTSYGEETTDDLSDEFKKIIEEKGIKYDYAVFQRVFGENEEKTDIQRKFYCDECQIEIKNFNNFLIHKANHEKQNGQLSDDNLDNGNFKCFCGKIFLYKISYTQHLKIHNNIRKYRCNLCNFKAFNSTHLQRHIRTHTKEKNHTCLYCFRKFAEKYNMNSHIKKQHLGNKCVI